MNELMNDNAVYRTAPATPGLLMILNSLLQFDTHDFNIREVCCRDVVLILQLHIHLELIGYEE